MINQTPTPIMNRLRQDSTTQSQLPPIRLDRGSSSQIYPSPSLLLRGGWGDPHCAHRSSTFRSCAICEHRDFPSYPVIPSSIPLVHWSHKHRGEVKRKASALCPPNPTPSRQGELGASVAHLEIRRPSQPR